MLLGDEFMILPYMRCPFISQYPCTTQSSGYQGEQYSQYSTPLYEDYPTQAPYGMYEDTDTAYIYPSADPRQDPPPILSNNPATANISLFKELTAYPNYGNPSRNADILYTGNQGTWTFQSPAFLFVPGNQRARIIIRAVLDDHSNVPVNRYSARITVNGTVVHNGRVPLDHGTPAGGIFTNWRDLSFNVANLRRVNRVTIQNTSTAGTDDWIAFDWMELRISPR